MTKRNWSLDDAVEIELYEDDNFLQIKETLTRIGIASDDKTRLFQTCHILSKGGKYYIIHFKGMISLDNKRAEFQDVDYARQCKIAYLLQKWNLCHIVSDIEDQPNIFVKVVPFNEKGKWELVPKYVFRSDR